MKLKYLLLLASALWWSGVASAGSGQPSCPSVATPVAGRLIELTCRDLHQKLAEVPGARVRRGGTAFLDPRFDCTREGCVIGLEGSYRALDGQPSPDTWLGEYLRTKGWSRILSYDADGPDGTIFALHQPGALCLVEGRWNHWHDEDGEGHTDDAYKVTVSCGSAEEAAPRPPE